MDASQPVYWEEGPAGRRAPFQSCNPHDETHRLKEENSLYNDTNLNFNTAACSEDDYEYAGGGYKKSKSARQDPMSHRIIEKRRRDRMNNCLADLSRLIPAEYLKKGRGRVEKTEIIEMAIKHMKYLQSEHGNPTDHYRLGYQECMSETMRFLVEIEGHFPREPFCLRLLDHLQAHGERVARPSAYGGGGVATPASRGSPAGEYAAAALPQDRNNNESEAGANNGEYCKNAEAPGAASYKYKTNIKLRFSRDTNGTAGRRIGNERRGSMNSVENRSSSYGSPPSGEAHTRASESDFTQGRSPSGSTSSVITPKLEPPANDSLQIHASGRSSSPPLAPKNPPPKRHPGAAGAAAERNFDVPIFALHAKRSHYVPLAVEYRALAPYLGEGELLEGAATDALHPVTINVRFAPSCVGGGFGEAGGKCRGYCDWT
ncbi:unnamed protein product [Phyllotreta striolata]|uniref:Hairy/enhancer-of-split related with YRPW motif protein n=1 Tax=Phyllotreta striolata TaxID=444603 RepID=A0A9N9TIL5_PHYSR|nr:unnamed protein product [Phyllotreta striolata]